MKRQFRGSERDDRVDNKNQQRANEKHIQEWGASRRHQDEFDDTNERWSRNQEREFDVESENNGGRRERKLEEETGISTNGSLEVTHPS